MIYTAIITIILGIIAIFCFVLTYQFKRGEWTYLIAGYNDLRPHQKEKVDINAICKSASHAAFWSGIYIIVLIVALQILLNDYFPEFPVARILGIIIPTIVYGAYIIYAAIDNNKYYKNI
ncbi:DUF3784 domain-containing protein [Vagococcus coleopterorum]|uniref:DUF3784 domain-containing protein n=1 Tax=Vagococcus coleopterorum TaxID=2714946 RepID=A0A6G8APE7_9ENTE|nr:DUF3784 domain-containing protein [Vagococcus coleopterorum]QIL46850.1 DUF3784 domain-containing protein [Vagococcus coleopterorum]